MKKNQGYYSIIQERIFALFESMCSRYSKVLFVRFDLTFPADHIYPYDNRLLSDFIEKLCFYFKNQREPGVVVKYIWAREMASGFNHHYHFVILLDGHKVQNPYGLYRKAKEIWGNCLGADAVGLVHYRMENDYGERINGIMLKRNSVEFEGDFEFCLNRAYYLAKVYSKGSAPKGVREFGMSRL